MPYYCTVPRCTSMAGKAKNVSFHQFPRDEELAKLWNNILKRGKPYTKYSKVCSLHFKPEDYTVTSAQKSKGSWRTLRKDAIPSQNLPFESSHLDPGQSSSWAPSPPAMDTRMHHQMAQAIYVQTMLAMQAASITIANPEVVNNANTDSLTNVPEADSTHVVQYLDAEQQNQTENPVKTDTDKPEDIRNILNLPSLDLSDKTYKCELCSKHFKDPDVFILHRRTHTNTRMREENELNTQNTLQANPMLANLLASVPQELKSNFDCGFNTHSVKSIENQIMKALAANMENYLRNLSTIMTHGINVDNNDNDSQNDTDNDTDDIDASEYLEAQIDSCDIKDFESNEDIS